MDELSNYEKNVNMSSSEDTISDEIVSITSTGKTLMARQIGIMLNAFGPKIVNSPEILNKFVDVDLIQISAKIKNYTGAEIQGLVLAAILNAMNKLVSQSQGKVEIHPDAVESLLVIYLNLIDEALLRPGRLEVQMEINFSNEEGRLQILNIHTSKLQEHKKLHPDIDLKQISVQIKNYSGAEIEGLVRAATTNAMNKFVSQGQGKVEIHPNAI
ncbi:vesicle-fusing ATPase-like [Hydra vulgaris]|uniref:Vesicle-fusing ATPase n=1 Tax=Hydra vulgaris TaxID=6087 RepID=A0ABM4DBC5_HYDVU